MLLTVCTLTAGCGPARQLTAFSQTESSSEAKISRTGIKSEEAAGDALRRASGSFREETTETAALRSESVPEDSTLLKVPTKSIIELPDGALYRSSSGRVSVEARKAGDSIVLYGRADSVAARTVFAQRRTAVRHETIDSLESVIRELRLNAVQTAFEHDSGETAVEEESTGARSRVMLWFLAGALTALLLLLVIRIVWKRFNLGTWIAKGMNVISKLIKKIKK